MPWLTGTAFLHSVMMQEKRGMLKVWNMWLVFATFWLAILGTFLTRSGIISSVHAFAQSSIGGWFGWFLIITLAAFLYFFWRNKSHLRSEHKLESLVSRESSFLFNNLLFVLACFTILWGTWFPKISELAQGHQVTVGAPFYNSVAIPVALLLLLLTALGPLLAWRKTSLESLKRNFLWPALGASAVGLVMMISGVRPWNDISYFYALMAAMLAALVSLTVISEFIRGGRVISAHSGQNLFASMVHLLHRNTRRYGGYIVHFGVAVLVIGMLGTPSIVRPKKKWDTATKWRWARTRWSASLTRRNPTRTTAASGPSSMFSGARSRSQRCIPSGASIRPASRRRPFHASAPRPRKTFTWFTKD